MREKSAREDEAAKVQAAQKIQKSACKKSVRKKCLQNMSQSQCALDFEGYKYIGMSKDMRHCRFKCVCGANDAVEKKILANQPLSALRKDWKAHEKLNVHINGMQTRCPTSIRLSDTKDTYKDAEFEVDSALHKLRAQHRSASATQPPLSVQQPNPVEKEQTDDDKEAYLADNTDPMVVTAKKRKILPALPMPQPGEPNPKKKGDALLSQDNIGRAAAAGSKTGTGSSSSFTSPATGLQSPAAAQIAANYVSPAEVAALKMRVGQLEQMQSPPPPPPPPSTSEALFKDDDISKQQMGGSMDTTEAATEVYSTALVQVDTEKLDDSDDEDDKEENRSDDDDAQEEEVDATSGKRKLRERFKELHEIHKCGWINEGDYNKQKKKLMKLI
jgi:hypothetical protein